MRPLMLVLSSHNASHKTVPLFFVQLVLLLCSTCFGQLKLVEKNTETWANLRNAVPNADGTITTDVGSKPTLLRTNQTIVVKADAEYKELGLIVQMIPTLEKAELIKVQDGFEFKSGTVPGRYNIIYLTTIGLDSLTVTYPPVPGPLPKPDDPVKPDPVLDPDAEIARLIAVQYIHDTAADFDTAAYEIRSGRTKTSSEVQTRGNALDLKTRTKFKKDIGDLMTRIIKDPPSPEGFETLARGFKAVK